MSEAVDAQEGVFCVYKKEGDEEEDEVEDDERFELSLEYVYVPGGAHAKIPATIVRRANTRWGSAGSRVARSGLAPARAPPRPRPRAPCAHAMPRPAPGLASPSGRGPGYTVFARSAPYTTVQL